ncbi:MAG: flagellar export chaperone FliS [Planctomycetota bacterium]
MAFDIDNPYFRHKVMTASPQELRLLLLEGAVHFVDVGREGLAQKDYEKVYEGFSQSKAIVMELITSLNHEVDPDLCARVQSLYTYIYSLLVDASFKRDDDKAREARERLEFEKETWTLLMGQLQQEGAAGAPGEGASVSSVRATGSVAPAPTIPNAPATPYASPDGQGGHRSFSVSG